MIRCRRFPCAALWLMLMIGACAWLALPAQGRAEAAFQNYNQALSYARENHPAELALGDVDYSPTQLLSIKNALSGDKKLTFSTTWSGCTFTEHTVNVNLTKIKKTPTAEEIEAIVQLCPLCKSLDVYGSRSPSSAVMGPIADRYPDISFGWKVRIKAEYSLSSQATTFSTFIATAKDTRLNDADLEALKYCKNLRALDLGHNNLYNLDFLKYVPNLELLIVACNHLTDISPIGQLEHLQYLELFTNKVTDLSPLKNCHELIDLNISNTRITSLEALDGLDRLERMLAEGCKSLPEEEMVRFQQTHPNCVASFSAKFVNTNWRTHPRYDHYRWCLKNYQWIPFDQPLPQDK